ncbi:MAG: enoyl-CoA hydratase-related protein [Planctomycetota bacterium]
MPYENLLLSVEDGIGLLQFNRPEVRNALNKATVDEVYRALDEFRADDSVGVVILTGAGDKAFVGGADIKDLLARKMKEGLQGINARLFTAIEQFEKPTIAAVNGFALGGGCEIAMACDLRVASEAAKFGLPETGLGIIPGAGGTQRLPRLVGLGKAKELVLTGEIIPAAEALRIGLVNQVVPPAQVLTAAKEMARKILSRGPLAVRLAKQALNLSARAPLDAGLQFEVMAQSVLFESADKKEGMTAFLEKRKPQFKGE